MKLVDLEPEFLKYVELNGEKRYHLRGVNRKEATGIIFLCPTCFENNKGPVGTHSIICWSPVVPSYVDPKPGRWNLVGEDFNNLSLVAGSSSVQLNGGCNAHFFIKEGLIRKC